MYQTGSTQRIDFESVPAPEQRTGPDYKALKERRLTGNESSRELVLDGLLAARERIGEIPTMTRVSVIAADGARGGAYVVIGSDLLSLVGRLELAMEPERGKQRIRRVGQGGSGVGRNRVSTNQTRRLHLHLLEARARLEQQRSDHYHSDRGLIVAARAIDL